MMRKSGKWLADWRDAQRRRHRKAFKSKTQAHAFQNKKQRETLLKKAHAPARSANSPKLGLKGRASSRPTTRSPKSALVPNAGKLGRHADVAVQFGGAPGAFSFVVEGAITDTDTAYTAQGTPITAADNNNLVSQKLDISGQIAFIRVKFTALANNVNVAATVTPD